MSNTVGTQTQAPQFASFDPQMQARLQNANVQTNAPQQADPWTGVQGKRGADERMQAYQGIVGNQAPAAGAQPQGANTGALMSKPIGQMTDQELQQVFGSDADRMKALGAKQPSLTASMIQPLRKDPQGLDNVVSLLTERSDLSFDDVVQKDQKGNMSINSTVRDERSRELMTNRTDIKPQALSNMANSFGQTLKQPALVKEAYNTSIDLLKTRTDIQPGDLGTLMARMGKGVDQNSAGGQEGGANAAATLDMFKTGAKLMTVRQDIGVQDVGKMSDAVSQLGGKKDDKSGMKIANAFSQSADYLMNKEGSSVNDVVQLAGAVKQKVPGQEGADADMRMNLFGQGLQLMKNVPQMNADGVTTMLNKASEGPPARQGQDLVNAFNTQSTNVMNGRASVGLATDKMQRPDAEGKRRQDGEIMLDKHGNEKGTTDLRPTLNAHQAATVNQANVNVPNPNGNGHRQDAPGPHQAGNGNQLFADSDPINSNANLRGNDGVSNLGNDKRFAALQGPPSTGINAVG